MAVTKTAAGSYRVDFRDQTRRRIVKRFDTHREASEFYKEALAAVPAARVHTAAKKDSQGSG